MFDWVLNTCLVSLVCDSYLATSMIIATLASCKEFIILNQVLCTFQLLHFAKIEAEFTEIVHSWKINEIERLNKIIFPIHTLLIGYYFLFNIICIKVLICITMMEREEEWVVTVAEIFMNYSGVILLMLVCNSDIKTKVFLLRRSQYQYCKETIGTRKR